MKTRLLTILIVLISNFSFTQTKEEIIARIIKVNSLDGWDGVLNPDLDKNGLSDNNNYYNFEKLKKIVSTDELLDLTKHKNQVLRLYAIDELISENNKYINIQKEILDAIANKKIVQTHSGCIIDKELTYSIIYHKYWNLVRARASKNPNESDKEETELIGRKTLNEDNLLRNINSEILKLDEDLFWLIYDRVFEIEKYDETLKKNIIHLLFKYNNSYAFKYLKKNYPDDFNNIYTEYFTKHFSKAEFDKVNETFYLFDLVQYAFENNNDDMKTRILQKLRTTKGWEKELSGTFEHQIFNKYHIKL
ncbi:hypothetical protein [Chryseobacterium geocarposphaerae]|uniref:Uncharacterized protein n=1 Tax=Chryseobacterium geocarposphaerae TaxID=1416776 RepID=A0A2M9BY24_9FLAO|nr:hypothetical protein [Chryseobacterium geocarposphaerae]PJJ62984.1 hypothetical protein CLV73_3501 [Chryseobacterium geocarposphaerae]